MSKLTLDEAIKHCLEVADQEEQLSKTGKWFEGEDWNVKAREYYAECAADHRQLAEWLRELKEAKRLLKLAVEDMNDNNICYDINACNVCTGSKCISCDTFKWRYTNEVEKILNDRSCIY